MSLFDNAGTVVTPAQSDESRVEARSRAHAASTSGDWLSMVLQHHVQIKKSFVAVKAAADPATRVAAQRKLGVILTGHSIAEETVLYPALMTANEKGQSTMAYTEHSAAKVQMALLERIAPMTQPYLDKLEHIQGAVAHHVYEEEGTWLIELKEKISAVNQAKWTQRYKEKFTRYVGADAM